VHCGEQQRTELLEYGPIRHTDVLARWKLRDRQDLPRLNRIHGRWSAVPVAAATAVATAFAAAAAAIALTTCALTSTPTATQPEPSATTATLAADQDHLQPKLQQHGTLRAVPHHIVHRPARTCGHVRLWAYPKHAALYSGRGKQHHRAVF
jgi:hypothetical protein